MSGDSSSRTPLGLYLHVPFCRTRCRYCDFYRVGENRDRMSRFVAALRCEIDGWTDYHGRAVDTVFLGGGTPSLLEADEVAEILALLADRFAFAGDTEITLEANPSDLSRERLVAWRTAGVNRLSLGVQSLCDRELKLLGRRHDSDGARQGVLAARAAGFANVSLDLILAIPAQTDASFRRTLEGAVELTPDHLSLYLLEVHEGSELDYLRRERPALFPGEEAQRRRYLEARRILLAAGYEHYEISNFARPGRRCRHNLKYWRLEPFLGLGPSAHSCVDGRRFRHPPDLEGSLANPMKVEELPSTPAVERVFLGLRLAEGVAEEELSATGLTGGALSARLSDLAPFVERAAGRIRLRPEAYVVSTPVLAELLTESL